MGCDIKYDDSNIKSGDRINRSIGISNRTIDLLNSFTILFTAYASLVVRVIGLTLCELSMQTSNRAVGSIPAGARRQGQRHACVLTAKLNNNVCEGGNDP
jgi:hypothetical protein